MVRFVFSASSIAFGVLILGACSSSGGSGSMPPSQAGVSTQSITSQVQTESGTPSILAALTHKQTIGSAVNPVNGDVNPYGLDVAKVTSGKIKAGDLIVCDFNDPANVQGTGKSILALHPIVGSRPVSITGFGDLTGCNALVAAPNGTIWSAAFTANDNPLVNSSGTFLTNLRQFTWHHPFGQAF